MNEADPNRLASSRRDDALHPAQQDRLLVDQCLASDPAAWSTLYQRYQRPLQALIAAQLRPWADSTLVDEITARVWFSLVKDDFRLLDRFDPARECSLETFLLAIAKNEARQVVRSELRRRVRERQASRPGSQTDTSLSSLDPMLEQEFVATLTAQEKRFYQDVLLSGSCCSLAYSEENRWQLTCRIRRKLTHLLGRKS